MKYLVTAIAVALTVGCATTVADPEASVFPKTLPFPTVQTMGGDSQPGAVDGSAARVNRPHGLSYAKEGSLFFADRGNHQVRVLRPDGTVATVAGTVVLAMWMTLVGGAAAAGVLARFDRTPPPMALLLPVIFGGSIVLALSAVGRSIAQAWPVAALVGVQMFRLPLELVMHRAARLGIMPEELSYSGCNLDIVTGATAVVIVAVMARRPLPRAVLWAWNLWGVWCLLVIAWVARTGSPLVRGFGDDPRHVNTWVLYLPYVWLPAVLVMIALTGHLVLTRKLLTTSRADSYTSSHR